ncbi:MAG: DUF3168 domain-containing protein [Patescibacteria group bacterium]|nr:DUF3168 domain-containing protein [Patescibacteria group bacterium]
MQMQEGLVALLKASSALTALIGTRVFAVEAPPDLADYPCMTYALVGGSSDLPFDNSGVTRQRVEFNGLSFKSYDEATKIRAAIAAAVDGWTQKLTDGTNILNSVSLNPGTDFVTEQRCFRCLIEFYIDYTLPS